jgi:hypothetical protein
MHHGYGTQLHHDLSVRFQSLYSITCDFKKNACVVSNWLCPWSFKQLVLLLYFNIVLVHTVFKKYKIKCFLSWYTYTCIQNKYHFVAHDLIFKQNLTNQNDTNNVFLRRGYIFLRLFGSRNSSRETTFWALLSFRQPKHINFDYFPPNGWLAVVLTQHPRRRMRLKNGK